MQFDDALQYLLRLGNETLTMKLGLENIESLLAALNNPERSYLKVQIAGTNGKGSTAAMLACICRAASIKTGLYTSPHLANITERIRLNGVEISRDEFARVVERVREASEKVAVTNGALPTFFEQVTAAAFVAFRDAKVELAILETGLGGRLDATTAARARIVAITQIAFDHQKYLGDTITKIAAEKAATIHKDATAIIASQEFDEARRVIEERCRACAIMPRTSARIIEIKPCNDANEHGRLQVTFQTTRDIYPRVKLNLRGRHQASNAATAIALAEAVTEKYNFNITRQTIIEGLENARHDGRLELIETRPAILFDGAHNTAGAWALRAYLDEFNRAPLTLVFGAMADKDLSEITALLFPAATQIILTEPPNERAAKIEDLLHLVPKEFDSSKIKLVAESCEALRLARTLTPRDGLICVTGSLYLVGALKEILAREAM